MTNINCTRRCIFQKDGICAYDNTTVILKNTVLLEEKGAVCAYQSPITEKRLITTKQ